MEKNLMDNPFYAKAMEFLQDNDLFDLEAGKHIIDGDNLWLNIVDSKLKTTQEARLEVHDKYIDIQSPLSCEETFGIKPLSECTQPVGEMDPVKHILFYADPVEETVTVKAGEVITFEPDTAHAPLIGEGTIHKAIFKVRAEY